MRTSTKTALIVPLALLVSCGSSSSMAPEHDAIAACSYKVSSVTVSRIDRTSIMATQSKWPDGEPMWKVQGMAQGLRMGVPTGSLFSWVCETAPDGRVASLATGWFHDHYGSTP